MATRENAAHFPSIRIITRQKTVQHVCTKSMWQMGKARCSKVGENKHSVSQLLTGASPGTRNQRNLRGSERTRRAWCSGSFAGTPIRTARMVMCKILHGCLADKHLRSDRLSAHGIPVRSEGFDAYLHEHLCSPSSNGILTLTPGTRKSGLYPSAHCSVLHGPNLGREAANLSPPDLLSNASSFIEKETEDTQQHVI